MELSVSLPVDGDDFLSRACPACNREFKWLPSDDSEPPDDARYGCPYCRARFEGSEFLTEAQRDAVTAAAGAWMIEELRRRGWDASRSEGSSAPLMERDDMVMVTPTCHAGEPVKVYNEWAEAGQTVHCIVCGADV